MNIIDTLYDNEDLSTDQGIEAICKKITDLNVSIDKIMCSSPIHIWIDEFLLFPAQLFVLIFFSNRM